MLSGEGPTAGLIPFLVAYPNRLRSRRRGRPRLFLRGGTSEALSGCFLHSFLFDPGKRLDPQPRTTTKDEEDWDDDAKHILFRAAQALCSSRRSGE